MNFSTHRHKNTQSMKTMYYNHGNNINILFKYLNICLSDEIDEDWSVFGEYTRRVLSEDTFMKDCEINILVSDSDICDKIIRCFNDVFYCLEQSTINDDETNPYYSELIVNIRGYRLHMTLTTNSIHISNKVFFTVNCVAFTRGDPSKMTMLGYAYSNDTCFIDRAHIVYEIISEILDKQLEWIISPNTDWSIMRYTYAIVEMVKLINLGYTIDSDDIPKHAVRKSDNEYYIVLKCGHEFSPCVFLEYLKTNPNPICIFCHDYVYLNKGI